MNPLNKLIVLLLLVGFYVPSYAAVNDLELISCSVYSDSEKDGEKKDGKEGGNKDGNEEEEPDCE